MTTQKWDGIKMADVHGTSSINVLINRPPRNGHCTIDKAVEQNDGSRKWEGPAETGRALVDDFRIQCKEWEDPDGHQIIKYVFKSERVCMRDGGRGEGLFAPATDSQMCT